MPRRLWLLTASIAGQPLRWSSEPVDITDATGRVLPYRGGLAVEEVELLAAGPGATSQPPRIGFEAAYPRDIDYAELVEAGHSIAESTAEIALWSEGQTYEQRRVMLRGIIDEDEADIDGQPIRGTLTAPEWTGDGVSYPPPGAVVDRTTHAALAESWIGAVYPWIIGRPGAGDGAQWPGSPALPVERDPGPPNGPLRLVIAGHRVAATQVRVWYGEQMTDAGLYAVAHTTDLLGRTYASVVISGTVSASDRWWISWEKGAGLLLPDGTAAESLGDALYWAAWASGLDLDLRAWSALRAALRGWRFGAVIDAETPIWRWAEEVLLPLAPIEVVHGPDGARPMLWRYDAPAADAVLHLEAGRNVSRAGPVERSKLDQIVNRWRITYALRPDGESSAEIVVGSDERSNPACVVSQARYGVQEQGLELLAVARESTAGLAAGWRVATTALQHRTTTYGATADDVGELRPGDVVTITDADRGWLSRVAHVTAVRWLSTVEIEVALLLLGGAGSDRVD